MDGAYPDVAPRLGLRVTFTVAPIPAIGEEGVSFDYSPLGPGGSSWRSYSIPVKGATGTEPGQECASRSASAWNSMVCAITCQSSTWAAGSLGNVNRRSPRL